MPERLIVSEKIWVHPFGFKILNKNQQVEIQLYIDELLAIIKHHEERENGLDF